MLAISRDMNYKNWQNDDQRYGKSETFSLLKDFQAGNIECQNWLVSTIEKVCEYSLSSEQKTAFLLSIGEINQKVDDRAVTLRDLTECWLESPLLKELAIKIEQYCLF